MIDDAMEWLKDLAALPNLHEHEFAVAILAQLSAANRDVERVDWLEKKDCGNPSRLIQCAGVWHYTGDTASEDREGETLRAAIDKAMQSHD